jgi:hypothetical protein
MRLCLWSSAVSSLSVDVTSMEYQPVAVHATSRAHGRVDAVILLGKAVLCILFACHHDVKRNVLEVAVCLFSALYCYGYLVYLPYYDMLTNKAHGMLSCVLLWASMCLVLRHLRDASASEVPASVMLHADFQLCCCRL